MRTLFAADHLAELPQLCLPNWFPDILLDVPATELWRHLQGPTLFNISGRQTAPLFVTVLLHGDEDTGWKRA